MQDLYIVNWLIKNTEKPNDNIKWQPHEQSPGIHVATIKGATASIDLRIGSVSDRTGSRVIVELSSDDLGKVLIEEPHMSVSLRRKYDSDDDKALAEALRNLICSVRFQDTDRERQEIGNKEERKKAMFKRLLDTL